tara:strand:+ start:371 stop:781 length:411 start_codon:yes stop_codon:yes gene_type:complete
MNSEPNVLVKQISFDAVRDKGSQLLEENEFFKDLSTIMENKVFSSFFKKYFKDTLETKITIVYMKLYQEFKEKWKGLDDSELDARINTYLIWKIMRNKKTNKFAIRAIKEKLDNPNRVWLFNDLKEFFELEDKGFE